MGNNASSPQHSSHNNNNNTNTRSSNSRSRSRPSTPATGTGSPSLSPSASQRRKKDATASVGKSSPLKRQDSRLRRKIPSIELPDLRDTRPARAWGKSPGTGPAGGSTPSPRSKVSVKTLWGTTAVEREREASAASAARSIPGAKPRAVLTRNDSTYDKYVGGNYGTHIPATYHARANEGAIADDDIGTGTGTGSVAGDSISEGDVVIENSGGGEVPSTTVVQPPMGGRDMAALMAHVASRAPPPSPQVDPASLPAVQMNQNANEMYRHQAMRESSREVVHSVIPMGFGIARGNELGLTTSIGTGAGGAGGTAVMTPTTEINNIDPSSSSSLSVDDIKEEDVPTPVVRPILQGGSDNTDVDPDTTITSSTPAPELSTRAAAAPIKIVWREGGDRVELVLSEAGTGLGLALEEADVEDALLDEGLERLGGVQERFEMMKEEPPEEEGADIDTSSKSPPIFSVTLALRPGTHRIRFHVLNHPAFTSPSTTSPPSAAQSPESVVSSPSPPVSVIKEKEDGKGEGRWTYMLSKDFPQAVDVTGELANYVVVAPLPSSAAIAQPSPGAGASGAAAMQPKVQIQVPTPPPTLGPRGMAKLRDGGGVLQPGHSFWSAASTISSADGDNESINEQSDHAGQGEGAPAEEASGSKIKGRKRSTSHAPRWTQEIPEELVSAAREEETYLNATNPPDPPLSSGREGRARETQVITGFNPVPAPNIPPAPSLPRHLDKLILNTRAHAHSSRVREGSPGSGSSGSPRRHQGGSGSMRRREREREREMERERRALVSSFTPQHGGEEGEGGLRASPSQAVIPVTTASGTDVTATALLSTTANAAMALTSASSFASASAALVNARRSLPPSAHRHMALRGGGVMGGLGAGGVTGGGGGDTGPGLADDASVLPVPSHAVLKHLSTSAIRNGVLAVGGTTRYREKFLTTIYYKPT